MSMIHNDNTHHLNFEDKKITLIGTAHVSFESADLVQKVIEDEKPDMVCVELCESRYQSIMQKSKWENTNLLKVIKEKKAFLLLSNLMLAYFQKKVGQKLGIRPGEEIVRAIQAATSVGARIHLADRDIRTTLSRTWRCMGLWAKIRLLFQLVTSVGEMDSIKKSDIEEMKKKDVLEMFLSEIGKSFPEIRRILIDERDQYLAHMIRSAPGKKIVAVVGAGHVPGIQSYWERHIDLDALNQIPPKSSAGTSMIKWWVLANAILAGLGAAIALGHPLTILSAIVSSPITSLNPMIAAGWVAGLVEVFLGKPKVKDFERLSEDISSLKGFWKNKITRILLVVAFTNIGSSVGTFVAIPLMVKMFA